MAKKPSQHVVPHRDGWAVKKAGASRATVVKETQEEAMTKAKEVAKNQEAELMIHGRDGKIREKNSYGKDPHPPKG